MHFNQLAQGGLLLLSLVSALPQQPQVYQNSLSVKRQNTPDKTDFERTMTSFAEQGMCLAYLDKGAKINGLEPCLKYCKEQTGKEGAGCETKKEEDVTDESLIFRDSDGFRFHPMPCNCDLDDIKAISGAISEVVFDGMSMLEPVICAVWLEAFTTTIDVGLKAIPVTGRVHKAAKKAVKAAKTLAENGMGASEYESWVGKTCDLKDWDFDIKDAFVPMEGGSVKDFGGSLGCMLKGRDMAKCKDPEE